jgi:gamma-glutamylcyclotransferase (GGCT)/AIG2-like uncharacterized protein YtfP
VTDYIFFYGTLMRDFASPDLEIHKLEFIGEGFVYGKLYDLGAYPGVILSDSQENKVFGEIFRLPDGKELARFDEYEGFCIDNSKESLFTRKITTAYLQDRKLNCWIYEYNWNVDFAELIESGDYKEYMKCLRNQR